MPTYDYACSDCGHRFDIKQSWSDDPLTVCPECSGAIRRVLHPAGVIFKGSGWYITDNRKGSASDGATSSTSDSSDKTTTSTPAKKETATAADS